MGDPFLSVIIPAFNEVERIVPTLEDVVVYLTSQSYSWEVLVVDDGSSDGTATAVNEWALRHEGVRVETIPHTGKGWAVRHGILATAGQYRFMCDADLAMPIQGLASFLERMSEDYDVVIGSRQVAGARRFNKPMARRVMGRVFNWAVRFLVVGGFHDTQCGFKCFRGEIADELFRLQKTEGFGFDVEILYLASKRDLRVLELPIDWYHQTASTVRPGVNSFLMLRDALLVRWNSLRGEYHRRSGSGGDARGSTASLPTAADVGRGTSESDQQAIGEVVVVVPTYNEAGNLAEMVERIFALDIPSSRVIVVDDNSPDGTAEVARRLADRFDGRLELIQRHRREGLGPAYVQGFARALEGSADYVLQADADLSHAPEYIPALIAALQDADVVVGSRYVSGGRAEGNWSLARRFVSSFANLGIRLVAGVKVKDATSGFKAFRAGALRSLDLDQFRCKGFGFQAEVAHACQRMGHRVVEHPIVFVERRQGRSKMSLSIMLEALWRLTLLRWRS